ncbi:MAG: hypothetical protein WCT99_00530 [Bacteroidota bacterium]
MKNLQHSIAILLLALGVQISNGQGGISIPLGPTGMENFTVSGVRSRAMGWSTIGNSNDASALFGNPAMLSSVKDLEIRFGGISSSTTLSQRQEWNPDKVYATLSLLLEDRLVGISDTGQNQITLERKYDNIGPNWEKKISRFRPGTFAAAIPFDLFGIHSTAAIGYSEAVNLDHYFQNNNTMDPYIGSHRPEPYPRPVLNDTIRVQWYQFIRQREGSIYGITPGLSITPFENFSIGLSATILTGTSDDYTQRNERGKFRFTTSSSGNFNVYFVDSVYYHETTSGTSTYSGLLTTIGFSYSGNNYTLGAVLKPGGTVTQKFSGTTTVDTTGSSLSHIVTATNDLHIPFTYAIGGSFKVAKNITIAIDYLFNKYSGAEYSSPAGSTTNPWLKGEIFRMGMEFLPIKQLALRCGYKEDTQIFSPEGAPIIEDPVKGYGLTAGAGINLGMITFDVAYEYSQLDFEDKWISNTNYTQRFDHTIAAETSIHF